MPTVPGDRTPHLVTGLVQLAGCTNWLQCITSMTHTARKCVLTLQKAKALHPDLNSHLGQSDAEAFLRLAAAYEVLSDAEQRRLYDAATDPQLPDMIRRAAAAQQQQQAGAAGAAGPSTQHDAGTTHIVQSTHAVRRARCHAWCTCPLDRHTLHALRVPLTCIVAVDRSALRSHQHLYMSTCLHRHRLRVTAVLPYGPAEAQPAVLYCICTSDASLNWRWGMADWARYGPASSPDVAMSAAEGSPGSGGGPLGLRLSVLSALRRHQRDLEVELHAALMTACLGPRSGQ
jgi:hypothetical protein